MQPVQDALARWKVERLVEVRELENREGCSKLIG